ncbi:MAG TPA: hypothetical protein VFY56_07565 [Propionibacteriaceae bacterium]|nr:hypothetical protein [Propionibacteriaceae bacterium]
MNTSSRTGPVESQRLVGGAQHFPQMPGLTRHDRRLVVAEPTVVEVQGVLLACSRCRATVFNTSTSACCRSIPLAIIILLVFMPFIVFMDIWTAQEQGIGGTGRRSLSGSP